MMIIMPHEKSNAGACKEATRDVAGRTPSGHSELPCVPMGQAVDAFVMSSVRHHSTLRHKRHGLRVL